MSIWIVIPTKAFEEGKGRLASVLSDGARAALNRAFFAHTLQIALSVWPADRTLVVSRSKEARSIAHSFGAQVLAEEQGGLNAALSDASTSVAERGATGVLAVSCDLPLLAPPDLRAMLAALSPKMSVRIAADRRGQGTNALLVSPAGLVPYHYGSNSFAAHLESANAVGANVAIISRSGLAFDVDTPDDLEQLRRCSVGDSWPLPERRAPSRGDRL